MKHTAIQNLLLGLAKVEARQSEIERVLGSELKGIDLAFIIESILDDLGVPPDQIKEDSNENRSECDFGRDWLRQEWFEIVNSDRGEIAILEFPDWVLRQIGETGYFMRN